MAQTPARFPVGGSKDALYDYLTAHGFSMSNWSDKHWTRADGLTLHIYGSGSMARIYGKDAALIADSDIASAVALAKQAP